MGDGSFPWPRPSVPHLRVAAVRWPGPPSGGPVGSLEARSPRGRCLWLLLASAECRARPPQVGCWWFVVATQLASGAPAVTGALKRRPPGRRGRHRRRVFRRRLPGLPKQHHLADGSPPVGSRGASGRAGVLAWVRPRRVLEGFFGTFGGRRGARRGQCWGPAEMDAVGRPGVTQAGPPSGRKSCGGPRGALWYPTSLQVCNRSHRHCVW